MSEFFRNAEAWEVLRTRFLGDLLARPVVHAWSAGCSLGYEPHTISMLVREQSPTARLRVTATDVDGTILERARLSRFSGSQMAGISAERRSRFFLPAGDAWEVRPELRKLVTWARHDLLGDPFEPGFDLIVCRNVVIYFTEAAKGELYRRFADALTGGGLLFVGATESIAAPAAVGLEPVAPGFFRKLGERTRHLPAGRS